MYARSVAEVQATCLLCATTATAVVDEADFARYCEGAFAQVAFPEATIATREVVIGWRSGAYICEACSAGMED